ncbi:hypothetical protein [Hansschlegelia plantiphila]|uniref:Uncharacterized protein n=1 Tax=Hansschlegelia plantiphila TaxID=374655 RepID=A0A9W6MVG5_9HYPH|nr:hypothetical protein [Hansschlegelia plantiphila]GLK67917.1 hypothetical protein GCM10008179_15550 [Hansschlegelia plantiphila]
MTASAASLRRDAYAHDDAKLAALEQRVYGLERGVQDLNQLFTGRIGEVSAQLSGLTTKLDDRSRTPWATIVSAMGVVLAIVIAGGQLVKTPVDDAIRRLERDVTRLDGSIKGVEREAREAQLAAPGRGELEARWILEERSIDALQRRLDRYERAPAPGG